MEDRTPEQLKHENRDLRIRIERLEGLIAGYYATTMNGDDTALLRKTTRGLMPDIDRSMAHVIRK